MNPKNTVGFLVSTILTALLLFYFAHVANGQNNTILLQKVTIKDKVLEKNLRYFVDNTNAKAVSVLLEKRDSAYLYNLSVIDYFEAVAPVKGYQTPDWGEWKNRILVFRSGSELNQVCTISDTVAYDNLLRYLRPVLPNMYKPVIVNGKKVADNITLTHNLEWTFRVENGREIWLWTNDGYDSRDILEPKPE